MSLLEDPKWLRAEMWTLAGFHVALGLGIAFAPARLVVTPSALEAFRIMPNVITVYGARLMWCALFCTAGALMVLLSMRTTLMLQHFTWGVAVFADGLWFFAFAAPLIVGRGSVPYAIGFLALLTWCFFMLRRVAHSSGDECGAGRT